MEEEQQYEEHPSIKVVDVLTFDDLDDHVTVQVRIPRPGGRHLVIPVQTLNYDELLTVEAAAPMPTPGVSGVDKNGRPVIDNFSEAFKQKRADAIMRRRYLLLAYALGVDVPGDTDDEKIASLKKLDAPILNQLLAVVETMHYSHEAYLENRANSFRSEGSAPAEDPAGPGLDDAPVDAPAEPGA